MGGVDLGSVKARLEFDASGVDAAVARAQAALAKLGASSEQTARYLAELEKVPAQYRNDFLRALEEEAKAVDRLGDSVKRSGSAFASFSDAFKKGLAFGGAAALGARAADFLLGKIDDLGRGMVDLVIRGSEVQKIGGAFQSLAASVGASSEQILAEAQKGTRGLVSNFDLMQAANKGILLGLPITAKEMGVLSSAATQLGRAMDQDARKSLDDLIVGLGRGSPKILDNLGIIVKANDAYQKYADAHNTTTKAMTAAEKQTAFYSAAIEAARQKVESMGETALTTVDKIQQLNVIWQNFSENTAVILSAAIGDIIDRLGFWGDDLAGLGDQATSIVNAIANGFVNMASIAINAIEGLEGAFQAAVIAMAGQAKELKNILTFQVNPITGLQNINAIGQAGLAGIGAGLTRATTVGFTYKNYAALSGGAGARPPGASPGAGGGAAAADIKALQAEIDKLSGAKAQKEMDLIAEAVKRIGVDGVKNVDAVVKQIETLATQGAKIPPILDPLVQKSALDSITADAQKAIANIATIKPEGESELSKWFATQADGIVDSFKPVGDQIKAAFDALGPSAQEVQAHFNQIINGVDLLGGTSGKSKEQLQSLAEQLRSIAAQGPLTAEQAAKLAEIEKEAGISAFDWSQQLQVLAQTMQALGSTAGNLFSQLAGGISGISSIIKGFSTDATKSFGSGLSGLFSNLTGKGGLSGVLAAVSGIASIAGTAISVVKSIAAVFNKPEYKKVMSDVGKSWGVSISEGLAKQIEQAEKQFHIGRTMAELLNVSKIIEESGKDPREFTDKIGDLMNAIKLGSVPAAEGLKELGAAFTQVADAALKAGTVGDKALVGIIKRARELGEVTPEMKDFINNQLQAAAQGVADLIDKMPAETQTAAAGQAAILAATFNAIQAEQGIVAASEAIGPSFDKLLQQITDAGLAIPDALQAIGRQMELGRNPQFAAASAGAAATSQALRGLANAGYLDTSVLGGAGDVAKQAFDQAKAAGATDKEAYQLIGSLLSDIKNASIQSGIALNDVEKQLISGASAAGVQIGEDQLTVLVQIRDILSGGGTTGTSGETNTGGGASGGGGTATGANSYQGGTHGQFEDFGGGTLAWLHGKEAITPEGEALPGTQPSQTTITYAPVLMVDPLTNNESRQALVDHLIDQFVRLSRSDSRLRYAINRAANGGR